MKDLRITQKMLSEELHINQGNLSSFLVGKRTIPLDDLERILLFLRLEITKLD